MDGQPNLISARESNEADPQQAARALGVLLRQMPEYEVYLKAFKVVNNDLTVQKLAAQMRSHQNALQWGRDGQHADELARLEQEIEALLVVQEYRQAETQVRQIFLDVDQRVSQEAGVAFAANAKRSGCCG